MAREKLSMLHLQTYSKRLVLGQPESYLFAVTALSFSDFCLYAGRKHRSSPLRFSVYIKGFDKTCDVGGCKLGKKILIVQKHWHFPTPDSCFFFVLLF